MAVASEAEITLGKFDPEQPVSETNYDNSFGEYDISPYQWDIGCGKMTYKLALGLDETTRLYKTTDCYGNEVQSEVIARPYAQLGSVDVSMENNCCCCGAEMWMVSTDGGIIAPAGKTGSCCNPTDKALVEEISAKLQERKVLRGLIA